jgi:hypothetical protein
MGFRDLARLFWGSLPEIVFTPAEKKQELLQSYFQTVVRKEIVLPLYQPSFLKTTVGFLKTLSFGSSLNKTKTFIITKINMAMR